MPVILVLQHLSSFAMMRPDGHLRAEESNGATTALSDGADFERPEDKDHVPTTKGGDALEHGGGRDKVAKPAQPALPAYRSPPSLPSYGFAALASHNEVLNSLNSAPPRLSSPHGHNSTPVLAAGTDGRRAHPEVPLVRRGAITQLTPLPP